MFIGVSGEVHPCSSMASRDVIYGNVNDDSIEDILACDLATEIKDTFNKGGVPDFCRECVKESNHGYNKLKSYYNESNKVETFKMENVWLTLSNKCPNACRMCSPNVSTGRLKLLENSNPNEIARWGGEELYKSSYEKSDNILTLLNNYLPDIERVNFNGGEPMLDKKFIPALKILQNKPNVFTVIHYSGVTMSESRFERITEVLKDFTDLVIEISVDGIGEVNDYQRINSDYKTCMKWYYKFREALPLAVFNTHVAITNINVAHVPELVEEFLTNHSTLCNIFCACKVEYPYEYQTCNMPLDERRETKKKLYQGISDLLKKPKDDQSNSAMVLLRTSLYALDAHPFDEGLYSKFIDLEQKTNNYLKGVTNG